MGFVLLCIGAEFISNPDIEVDKEEKKEIDPIIVPTTQLQMASAHQSKSTSSFFPTLTLLTPIILTFRPTLLTLRSYFCC